LIDKLSTAVVKVDMKVINASLTRNQRLQCATPPLTHAEILRLRDATELSMIKFVDVTTKQNGIYHFFRKRFNQR